MDFNTYQDESQKTWIESQSKEQNRERIMYGLFGELGEIAEKMKKAIRGDGFITKDDMAKEAGDVLYYLARFCDINDITLNDVAETNLEKLFSRKERGKIKGSGDNR